MGSVTPTAVTEARSNTQDDAEIVTAAKLLVDQHGNNADIEAARRADVLFRDGNTAEGTRWLEVFRRIAASYVSPK